MKRFFGLIVSCILFCVLFMNAVYAETKEEVEADKNMFETKYIKSGKKL